MSPLADGGTAELVLLHQRVPALSCPDPRSRQVFRRVLLLHRLTGGRVRVLALEAQPDADTGALPAEGVPLEVVTADPVELTSRRLGPAVAAWATDLPSARVLQAARQRADSAVPFLLELETLPSVDLETSGLRPGGRNTDGLDHLVNAYKDLERSLAEDASAVATTSEQVAANLEALLPGSAPEVIAPCTSPPGDRRGPDQRSGALHYGRWVSEPGHPDEDGLRELLEDVRRDGSALPRILSQDAPPRFRDVALRGAHVLDPMTWPAVLRTARVVLLPRRCGPAVPATVAELTRLGIPFLADASAAAGLPPASIQPSPLVMSGQEWAPRLDELLQDPGAWEVASKALLAVAESWLDDSRVAHETATLLQRIGVTPTDPNARAPGDHELAVRPPVHLTAGTARAALDLRSFEQRLLGPRLLERRVSLHAQSRLTAEDSYRLWRAAHEDRPESRSGLRRSADAFHHRPTISIVMPTYDSDSMHLLEALDSVRGQTWPNWQLCIADDGSTEPGTRAALERARTGDPRVQVTFLEQNVGIAAATNAALALADGDYVGFLDHDDVLRPTALHWIVDLLQEHPELDVVYTDEDRLNLDGELLEATCKPDWSPDLLLAANYMSHFTVIRRSVVAEAGGLRTGFDGAQDYDLLLRVTELTDRIGHVAKPLYSWRQSERSTALDISAKPEADGAGRRAVQEALDRRGVDGDVRAGYIPTWHDVRYRAAGNPLVSVLVPTRDSLHLLQACITAVRATAGSHPVELVVIDNDSKKPETLAYLEHLDRSPDATVVSYPERFNYARQINLAAAVAQGELLLLLNNDTTPRTSDWLDVLLGHGVRPEVGCVGARLLFPDGGPQHEGIAVSVAGTYAWNIRSRGYPMLGRNTRNTAAVTGACLLTRRTVFESVAGLDEQLRVAFNDVDYCRRVSELGYRIIYTPWAELEHDESASRGSLHPDDDEAFYRHRWGPGESGRDPFYSPGLDMVDPIVRFQL